MVVQLTDRWRPGPQRHRPQHGPTAGHDTTGENLSSQDPVPQDIPAQGEPGNSAQQGGGAAQQGTVTLLEQDEFQGLISTLQLVERLDRYPLRNKRKIDSVEPEETSMNVKKEGTQVQPLGRNPCLTKVYFYLSATALKWFENNEESIQTWKEFTSQLENVFGKKENSKLQAEKKLKTRAQLKGESTEFYIQDVLCLCKEVDPQMSVEDKISHLMKGIAEELYQALLPRDVQSTEQFITECRRVEALRCKRVTPTRYERLPNVASLCDQDDGEDLSSLIRKIVCEEIQQALDSPQEEPKIAANEDLVREEIVKTLAPISEPTISPPQAPRPVSNPKFEAQPRNPYPTSKYQKQGRRRDTNEWRTTEGRPICFYCGRPGHVVRYCRDRKRHNEERRKEYFQRKQDAM
ncbi:ASPRV1, partial [Cordylochernes scorpioides]